MIDAAQGWAQGRVEPLCVVRLRCNSYWNIQYIVTMSCCNVCHPQLKRVWPELDSAFSILHGEVYM